jgi:hypothetical protein
MENHSLLNNNNSNIIYRNMDGMADILLSEKSGIKIQILHVLTHLWSNSFVDTKGREER